MISETIIMLGQDTATKHLVLASKSVIICLREMENVFPSLPHFTSIPST